MLYAAHYQANELPNGLRLLIRAPEPNDDLAGAVQSQASPHSSIGFVSVRRPKCNAETFGVSIHDCALSKDRTEAQPVN